jgi:hypothetical protein
MNNYTNQVKELVLSLLEEKDQIEHQNTIQQIHQIFAALSNVSGYDQVIHNMTAVPTATGMAISMNHAAQCLLDFIRTEKFLKAVVQAIKDKQQQKPGQKIHFFYAGCGPYAPFMCLVAPLFSPEEIAFSLLEINRNSLISVRNLINGLGLNDYLKATYQADAVKFDLPNPEGIDILFSETLDALLYRESYVPILVNMLPQVQKSTIIIPENVTIELSSVEKKNPTEKAEITLLNTRTAIEKLTPRILPEKLPSVYFTVPRDKEYKSLILDTIVHIYKDYKLLRNTSSLTIPLEVPFQYPLTFEKIEFFYQLLPQVELQHHIH